MRKAAIDNEFEDLAEVNADFERAVTRGRVSVAALYQAASELEKSYVAAGYSLVRVAVPPQELVDGGSFRVVIVDGFIEAIDVSALPPRIQGVAHQRLAAILRKPRTKQSEMERAVLLAGDVPGARFKSALARGQEHGGTRLILEGEHRSFSGGTMSDNRLSSSLGGWGFNGNAAFNSLLGSGEQFYASYNGTPRVWDAVESDAPMRSFGVGAVYAFGDGSLVINPEYTSTTTRPEVAAVMLGTESQFERIATRLSYAAIKSWAQSFTLTGEISALNERTRYTNFNTELRHDRFAVSRAGFEWSRTNSDSTRVGGSLTLSQGLGGRDASEAATTSVPLSRLGAEPDFTKLNGNVRLMRPLDQSISLTLIARAQTSFGSAMFQSEQFALDATDAVSTFMPGSLSVDQGATVRGEISYASSFSHDNRPISIAPYLFAAGGIGSLEVPTIVETKNVRSAAFGAGARISLSEGSVGASGHLGLELGRRFSDAPSEADDLRLNVSMGLNF